MPAAASSASRRGSFARTIRCAAKYVNSPEGDLFRKGDLLYGLDLARAAIAKAGPRGGRRGQHRRDRAPAGGLRAGGRCDGDRADRAAAPRAQPSDQRLSLCFDADAAGQDATLRGMELAAAQGFDVRVVSLPPGHDPADDPGRVRGSGS